MLLSRLPSRQVVFDRSGEQGAPGGHRREQHRPVERSIPPAVELPAVLANQHHHRLVDGLGACGDKITRSIVGSVGEGAVLLGTAGITVGAPRNPDLTT